MYGGSNLVQCRLRNWQWLLIIISVARRVIRPGMGKKVTKVTHPVLASCTTPNGRGTRQVLALYA